jgi:hypothetical protein
MIEGIDPCKCRTVYCTAAHHCQRVDQRRRSIGLTDSTRHSGSALGPHYLQLALLYGMRHFAALAAVLMGSGLVLGLYPRIRLSSADGFQEQS